MSFIDLRLVLEHGREQGALKPGDLLCPVMSSVAINQAPMESEPSLALKSVICVQSACGMWNRCNNTPGKQ